MKKNSGTRSDTAAKKPKTLTHRSLETMSVAKLRLRFAKLTRAHEALRAKNGVLRRASSVDAQHLEALLNASPPTEGGRVA